MDDDADATQRPASLDLLLAEVDLAFLTTGADTPGWPHPHPGRDPLEEEYSRVTDAGKYRILDSRIDAWVQALADAGIADTNDVPAETWIAECRPPVQHLRVRGVKPVRSDGLALLLATTLVDGAPFGLDIGIGRDHQRPVLLTVVPACGCDACDRGSSNLLDELDGWVLTVARGGAVHARRGTDFATRTLYGGMTAGGGKDSWLDGSTPVPAGVERWGGASWV